MKNNILIALLSILLLTIGGCKDSPSSTSEEEIIVIDIPSDPLPSWNDGETKSAILAYVQGITEEGSTNFVPIEDRIATFDNDGNLWSEQPAYFQLFFAIDRVKAMAEEHPEWKNKQPYKAILENSMDELMKQGEHGLLEIVMATHSGMSSEEFEEEVRNWLATAKHPRFNLPYNALIYQPMLELLEYLRANDFKTFIVSGGGVDFMRVWTEDAYGIPPYQ
ncbi:MAG: HAD family hydrolase, partial [Eudoraea sp.]